LEYFIVPIFFFRKEKAPLHPSQTRHSRMPPSYVLSIDQGTTSTRCILFDAAGSPLHVAQKEHLQIFPQSGWLEHDPEEIWARTQDVVRSVLKSSGCAPADIASVGITNQRETLCVWNKDTGACYHNAIVWQDQRGAPLCKALADQHALGANR
jgi:glycerol kinase